MTRMNPIRVVSARLQGGDADRGIALVFVVGTMMVLGSLALTALAYVMANQKLARRDQDYAAAMAAAQSGVDDFISRLNRDDQYYANLDCSNTAEQGPTTVSNGCGWDADTEVGWMPVDASRQGTRDAFFHYHVDPSRAQTEGTVTLIVTGRVNGVYRTVESAVGKGGSTDYVYYTDFESADPSNRVAYSHNPSAACGGNGYDAAKYWWQGRSSANCSEIQFAAGDVLHGSVFSNDSILSNGATFTDGLRTADPACSNAQASRENTWDVCLRSGSSGADFNHIMPRNAPALYMDDTSGAFAGYPGCHYYGATRVVFHEDGTMTVWNKKVNNGHQAPDAMAPPGGSTPDCGSLNGLDSSGGATVDVPDDMVIYADDAPSSVSRRQCAAGQIGGPSGQQLPLGSNTDPLPTPTSHSTYTYDVTMASPTKTCQSGNIYIEGVLQGRVTVASAQSVVVTGDLVLAGGLEGTDMLGLVATNSVEVFQPFLTTVSTTRQCLQSSWSGCRRWGDYVWDTDHDSWSEAKEWERVLWDHPAGWPHHYPDPSRSASHQVDGVQIMGSIQTLQHSFTVQQYNAGREDGTLEVDGSIAQRWRGAVGQTGTTYYDPGRYYINYHTGYVKNYVYDTRLKYSAPPYFPRWVNAQWTQRYFGETQTPSDVKK